MNYQQRATVCIVDDDPNQINMIKDFIESKYPNTAISTFANGESALSGIHKEPDVLILDYHLDSEHAAAMNGIQVLQKYKQRYPLSVVVFMSANERPEIAANTIKYGAYDYVTKNEMAFSRMEIILNNTLYQSKLKKNLGQQKLFNILFLFALVLLLVSLLSK
ncbi:MAG: hypothetical protein RIQ89_252 [Bacteroidota bacterium]|jgi:DNA-binding NtrC family response regulator